MPSRKSKPKPKPRPAAGHQLRFEAIGTLWQIDIYEPVAPAVFAALEPALHARIEQFDRQYSRFREDSLVTAMSRAAGRYELPADAEPLFDLYRDMYRRTGGAVTPLIGRLLSDAGYDADYSLQPGRLTAPPAWDDALTYEFPYLTLHQPALLDLGAAGKGYLVDIISGMLEHAGISHYCVDAGGDMRYRGPAPLDVGLEHPDDPAQVIGVAHLDGRSLCGSAGNRRAWAGFTHIIDPRTQASPVHIKALWVTAPSTLLADALTTALYFAQPETLARDYDFDYAILNSDYSLEHSPGFPAEFFLAG